MEQNDLYEILPALKSSNSQALSVFRNLKIIFECVRKFRAENIFLSCAKTFRIPFVPEVLTPLLLHCRDSRRKKSFFDSLF